MELASRKKLQDYLGKRVTAIEYDPSFKRLHVEFEDGLSLDVQPERSNDLVLTGRRVGDIGLLDDSLDLTIRKELEPSPSRSK